uniref:Uncharacterized protein n=1 Tax=Anopheles coluzzii TaxID=1518534 RepID=A0A8W7P7G2_ANOCL
MPLGRGMEGVMKDNGFPRGTTTTRTAITTTIYGAGLFDSRMSSKTPSSGELRLLDKARFKAVTGGRTGTPPFCHTRSVFAFIGMLPVLPWWAGCPLASLLCSCSAPGTIGSP